MEMLFGIVTSKSLLIVRGVVGVIFFGPGAQKVFGCFGGPGVRGIISYFKQSLGIPAAFTVLAAFTECFEEPFMLDQLVARGSSDRSQTRPAGALAHRALGAPPWSRTAIPCRVGTIGIG